MDCVKIGDLVGGRFRVTQVIGAGSFAWVFVAEDLHSGQTVALKMLRPERFGDDVVLQRFEARELRLLERIAEVGHSPHVVRLVEKRLLRHEGLPYLVLEYVDGPSLKEWLNQHGTLETKEVARLGAAMARGLAVIHAAGGVHRDLKPSNVRMRQGKTPVLVDLGIARALWETQNLTQGPAPLTPRYAAPEQREGLPATAAADVYALGVCLYEMLAALNNAPPRLIKLAAACTTHDPRERPTVQQVIHTLDALASSSSSSQRASWPSVWPLAFLSGCSIFPGQPLPSASLDENPPCTPLAGFLRQTHHREAASTNGTFAWSSLDIHGQTTTPVAVKLLNFDPGMPIVVDDGAPGRYEMFGWFGEVCRHVSVHACTDRAIVQELEACSLPRPMGKSAIIRGDINRDGVDDLVTYGQMPATPDKPVSITGTILERHADGTSRLLENAFDLSAIDAYHMDGVRRVGDIDRDGCADLVVATYRTGGACSSLIHVLLGDCQGKFVLSDDVAFVSLPVNAPDLGDVDEDGFLDLVTGPDDDGDPGQTFLLRGNGHGFGQEEEVVDIFPTLENGNDQPGIGSVLLEDVNGDGHLDLLVGALNTPPGTGNNASNLVIHLGHGDGTFDVTPFVTESSKALSGITFLPVRGR